VQAGLIGLATPLLLLCGLQGPSTAAAYSDGDFTVIVQTHFSLLRYEQDYPEVALYRTRWLFFQKYLGHIALPVPAASVPELRTWWHGVSALFFEEDTNRGVAWQGGMAVPFAVNPSVRRQALRPTLPADALPPLANDTKGYTYVDEMPRGPGYSGNAQTALAQAIQQ